MQDPVAEPRAARIKAVETGAKVANTLLEVGQVALFH